MKKRICGKQEEMAGVKSARSERMAAPKEMRNAERRDGIGMGNVHLPRKGYSVKYSFVIKNVQSICRMVSLNEHSFFE